MPAATGTFPSRRALVGALAGSAVFGLAGLGIADALDAGRPTLAGPFPIGDTALLQTTRALAAL